VLIAIVLLLLFTAVILSYFLSKRIKVITSLKYELEVAKTINEQIKEKQELLSMAEQISQIGTWEVLEGNQEVRWSDELYKIYGFADNNFKPSIKIHDEIVAPDFREKVKKEINAAITNRNSFAVEYQIQQPSGRRKYVLGQGYYIEKDSKLVGTIQDITPLKEATLKLKINESLLREAEAVSHSGSWEWIEGSEFILCSDEMYRIHGHLPHSVFVNLPFYHSMIYEPDRDRFIKTYTEAYKNRGPFKVNYRVVSPNGEIKHLLSTAEFKRISLNNQYAYIGNTQDVTQLREAQVQLEAKMIELKRSNLDLEQFAYVASHDLQEPLRKIQAFGQRLKESHTNELSVEALDYLDRMYSASSRMRKLIDDLLTYSKATRDHKNFSQVQLAEIISKAVKELDYQIELRQALINVNVSETIEGLPSQLLQLFLNLLGNSLKFINKDLIPEISINAVSRDGQDLTFKDALKGQRYCLIQIEDNGIGFDPSDAGKIFDIFQRLTTRSEFEGTGIGLALCKKIVENHSGFISADGRPGFGATLTIALPIKHSKFSN
jgi:PAS domain S-box-containing protein